MALATLDQVCRCHPCSIAGNWRRTCFRQRSMPRERRSRRQVFAPSCRPRDRECCSRATTSTPSERWGLLLVWCIHYQTQFVTFSARSSRDRSQDGQAKELDAERASTSRARGQGSARALEEGQVRGPLRNHALLSADAQAHTGTDLIQHSSLSRCLQLLGRVIQWGLGFWGRLSEGRETRGLSWWWFGSGSGRSSRGASTHELFLTVAWLPRCARFALLLLFVSGPSSCTSCWAPLLWAVVFVSRTPSQQQRRRYLERKGDISLGLDVGFGSEVGTISLSNTMGNSFSKRRRRRNEANHSRDTRPRSTTVLLNGLDVVLMIEWHMIWTITSID